jgi:putative ABC transport system permease protein
MTALFRRMRRHPAPALLVILTLALGIGATTGVVSAIRGVLLAPLPFPNPRQLVSVYETSGEKEIGTVGFTTFDDWRRTARSYSSLNALASRSYTLLGEGEAEQLAIFAVTHETFSMYGLEPALGRDFTAGDDVREAPRRVILSDELWTRRFGRRRDVVGRVIRMSDVPFEVIGVMPPRTRLLATEWRGERVDAWVPLRYNTSLEWACRSCRHLYVVGRLRNGVTADQAARETELLTAAMRRAYPDAYSSGSWVAVKSLYEAVVGKQVRSSLWIVLAVSLIVLLAAISNAAGLRWTELFRRQNEISVRQSLGATPMRLAALLVGESLAQSLVASVAGIGLAMLAIRWLRAHAFAFLPRSADLAMDPLVAAVAAGIAIVSGILIGLVPGIRARRWSLRMEGRGVVSSRASALRLLVGVNVALSVVLVAGSMLMLRSVRNLFATPPGVDMRNVVSFRVSVGTNQYDDEAKLHGLYDHFLAQAKETPGVESAALTTQLPFAENNDNAGLLAEDRAGRGPSGDSPNAQRFAVSPDYFAALRIPLRRGRAFNTADNAGSEPVVILNETAARTLWPGGDALGRRVRIGGGDGNPFRRVVGVTGDVAPGDLGAPLKPQVYLPLPQFPGATEVTGVARTATGGAPLRELMRRLDPDVAFYRIRNLSELIDESESRRMFLLSCLSAFSAVAVALAMIGVYGMLSLLVSSRTRELGLRLALGSTNARVFRFVMSQGLRVIGGAVVAGVVASFFLGRLLQSLLFGVANGDPLTLMSVVAILGTATLLAAALPALRAARVSPMRALHEE